MLIAVAVMTAVWKRIVAQKKKSAPLGSAGRVQIGAPEWIGELLNRVAAPKPNQDAIIA
jgi:hypothetical protein